MTHVVLLGDSIFDNAAYVRPGPDVIRQVRARLDAEARATLLAVDGDVTTGVLGQLARLPADATHLFVSVGGNDALGKSAVLSDCVTSVADALARLLDARTRFERDYGGMVEALIARGLPATLCTIYDANYPAPQGRIVAAGLGLFNDVIMRAAFGHGLDLIDLRLICDDPADYANPIEPSVRGGEKIAAAIARAVAAPACTGASRVWAG